MVKPLASVGKRVYACVIWPQTLARLNVDVDMLLYILACIFVLRVSRKFCPHQCFHSTNMIEMTNVLRHIFFVMCYSLWIGHPIEKKQRAHCPLTHTAHTQKSRMRFMTRHKPLEWVLFPDSPPWLPPRVLPPSCSVSRHDNQISY